jgi:hypothetical protein
VGHYESVAVVEFLMRAGLSVTYLSSATSMTPYLQTTWRDVPALERFHRLGRFEALLRHHLVRIEADRCVVRPLQAPVAQARSIPADTVVLVTQNRPATALYDALRDELPELHLVGDAHAPRDVQAAIAEAHAVARAIA